MANAIPRSLLRAVYKRTLSIRTYIHGHGNWSLAGCPDDVSWGHDHIGYQHVCVAVSHQFISGEAARAKLPPFPLCSSRSPVGGDLPFDEGTLRAFRDNMWSDEHIYVSHDSRQPRRLDLPVSKAKQATAPSQIYASLPPAS